MSDLKNTIAESIMVLLFESLGTCLLTCLFQSFNSTLDSVGFFVGFFILLIFSARISGSHFNPAVTLAFMLRRDTGRFSRMLGLAYIGFQYLGAVAGTALVWLIFDARAPITVFDTTKVTQTIFQEMLGTALLTFLYLTQTEQKTKLSNDPAITTLIISAAYYAAIFLGIDQAERSISPLNPSVATGVSLFEIWHDDAKAVNYVWVFMSAPYLGSLLAVAIFEFAYKRSLEIVTQEVADEETGEGEEALVNQHDY